MPLVSFLERRIGWQDSRQFQNGGDRNSKDSTNVNDQGPASGAYPEHLRLSPRTHKPSRQKSEYELEHIRGGEGETDISGENLTNERRPTSTSKVSTQGNSIADTELYCTPQQTTPIESRKHSSEDMTEDLQTQGPKRYRSNMAAPTSHEGHSKSRSFSDSQSNITVHCPRGPPLSVSVSAEAVPEIQEGNARHIQSARLAENERRPEQAVPRPPSQSLAQSIFTLVDQQSSGPKDNSQALLQHAALQLNDGQPQPLNQPIYLPRLEAMGSLSCHQLPSSALSNSPSPVSNQPLSTARGNLRGFRPQHTVSSAVTEPPVSNPTTQSETTVNGHVISNLQPNSEKSQHQQQLTSASRNFIPSPREASETGIGTLQIENHSRASYSPAQWPEVANTKLVVFAEHQDSLLVSIAHQVKAERNQVSIWRQQLPLSLKYLPPLKGSLARDEENFRSLEKRLSESWAAIDAQEAKFEDLAQTMLGPQRDALQRIREETKAAGLQEIENLLARREELSMAIQEKEARISRFNNEMESMTDEIRKAILEQCALWEEAWALWS
jgi:hypothetical protein